MPVTARPESAARDAAGERYDGTDRGADGRSDPDPALSGRSRRPDPLAEQHPDPGFHLRLSAGYGHGRAGRFSALRADAEAYVYRCHRAHQTVRLRDHRASTPAPGPWISRRTAIWTSCWARRSGRRRCCKTTATAPGSRSILSPGSQDCAPSPGAISITTATETPRSSTGRAIWRSLKICAAASSASGKICPPISAR